MKALFYTFLVLMSSSSFSELPGDEYGQLVLGEIQKTFIKNHNVAKTFWQKSEKTDIKNNKVTKDKKTTKKPVTKKITEKKINVIKDEVRKPLIDNVETKDEGWAEYKKREKRGLIDDGDFVKYEPKKRKKYTYKKKETKNKNKVKVDSNSSWASQKMNEQSAWNSSKKSQLTNWEAQKKAMLKKWELEKTKYFKRIPTYKKNLVSKNVFSSSGSFKPNNEKLKAKFRGTAVVVVPNAFDQRVKDQGKRPTCTAFAATRALEIALAQTGKSKRLSDQYIYYASKPSCQQSPCSTKGSWALSAFQKSQASRTPDIPSQSSCPYSKNPKVGNETQIPLRNGCFAGEHKLKKFTQVKSLNQIIKALDRGAPVVSGFKLSPNFYKNKGVVLLNDSNSSTSMDSHAAGHAILLIGYMKIPSHLNEGKICFLTANSWGAGWGKGGHACLSEKWVKNFRFNIPFLAVEKVI